MTVADFHDRVLAWFGQHGRKDLPWQKDPTPYRVWVSEIMLQQTRVATVIPYFERFMRAFPDIAALAAAGQDEVLHHWSGLGYYARARNLHQAAGLVMTRHDGRLPEQIEALVALPGIGRSTAGAILSLACGQRHPILDGNVRRVLARHAAVEGWPGQAAVSAVLWTLAERRTPPRHVAAYNQAMMDLGATVCRRGRADCAACPVNSDCQARAQDRVHELPAPRPRRSLPVRGTRMLLLVAPQGEILLEQRPASGLWGGLWSLPELPEGEDIHAWLRRHYGLQAESCQVWKPLRHTFSHFHLDITPVRVDVRNDGMGLMEAGRVVWYNTREPDRRGLAAPVQRLLQRHHERLLRRTA